jgi:DNA-binding response OmpR family regulator
MRPTTDARTDGLRLDRNRSRPRHWRKTMTRILLVDDEMPFSRRCRSELIEDGHEVHAVPDARSALDWLHTHDADLVILDLEAPGSRDLDILAAILSRRRETRILVHTKLSCSRDFGSWGADAYVQKSDDLSPLRSAVADLLRKAA